MTHVAVLRTKCVRYSRYCARIRFLRVELCVCVWSLKRHLRAIYMDETSTSEDPDLIEPSGARKISFWQHYRLLLWKSFLLRGRQPGVLVFELLLPLILLCIVIGIRAISVPSIYPACHITASPLPSMGFFKHLRSIVCTANFTCTDYDYDGPPGEILDLPPWLPELANLASQSDLGSMFDLDSSQVFTDIGKPPAWAGQLLETAEALAKAYSAVVSSRANGTTNTTALLQLLELFSVPICGSRPGHNDFLGLTELAQSGNLPIGDTKDAPSFSQLIGNITADNATACSVINEFFAVETMRPWTLRLRTLMQGQIFYHPVTPLTQRIVRGANQTALMWARLKNVSNTWVNMEAEALPHILVNSSVSKELRRLAKHCKPLLATCRRLYYFLEEKKPAKPPSGCTDARPCLHWSDLIEPLTNLSAGVDNLLSTCINFDRFIGYTNATAMEEQAQNISATGQPVMILFFDAAPATSADLSDLSSTLFSTRFRLPFSAVDKTYEFKVVDKYWSPEPRRKVSKYMKYFTSGFIDVQEQIERSYLSIVTGGDNATTSAAGSTSTTDDLYTNPLLPVEMKFIPSTCFRNDKMLRMFNVNMPMIIVIIWICNAVFAVRAIVYEKECRLKEFTKVMGMGNLVHWLNWWTISLVTMGAPALVACLMLKFGGIYPNGDFFLILCVFLAYLWAIIPQAFFVSVFYSKANFGAVVAGLLYFVLFIPYAFFLLYDLNYAQYTAISICPQVAFALAFNRLGDLEVTGQGAQWSNLWGMELTNDSFTLGNCLVMLLVDGIIALICTAYLEAVLPSDYGVPLKWYFLLSPSFWKNVCQKCSCCQDKDRGAVLRPSSSATSSFSSSSWSQQPPPPDPKYDQFQEPPPEKYSASVSIRGLTKTYRGGQMRAVDNLWVDFYAGQITSFLGHNGAGKTTTMSILSGILPASGGDAFICGKSIKHEMSDIRTFLGLCPQYNVLYDHMTVREHLHFYCAIKGLTKAEREEETNAFLEQLELTEKADTLSMSLSGGQKRRLSLAAAFVGGSKVVFLDEPTAGVDPHSRRSIWQMILRFRASRSIILTTHHMDEADVLGDRIVIISQGHLRASGTSLFLKSNFAKYYYLTVEKTSCEGGQSPLKSSPEETDRELMKTLTGQMAGIQLINSNPTQWVLALPSQHAMDNGFADFFTLLDTHKEDFRRRFGFGQYGLTDISLEEIFLLLAEDPSKAPRVQVADGSGKCCGKCCGCLRRRRRRRGSQHTVDDETIDMEQSKEDTDDDDDDSMIYGNETLEKSSISDGESPSKQDMLFVPPSEQSLTGFWLYAQQFKACFVKRMLFVKRSRRGWFLEMVLPALTVLILMLVTSGFEVSNDQPNMPINPWLMADLGSPPKLATFFATNVWAENFNRHNRSNASQTALSDIRQISQRYADQILTRTGWSGAKCLPPDVYEFIPSRFAGCSDSYIPPSTDQFSLTAHQLDAVRASTNITCSCESDGNFPCGENAVGGFAPPIWSLATTDNLYNLTGYNISDYLLKTRYDFILKRYGGLEFVAMRDPALIGAAHDFLTNETRITDLLNHTFTHDRITALGLDIADILRLNLPPTHFARVWYYNKGYVASVAYLNLLHNLQLRMLLPDSVVSKVPRADRSDFAILASTQPMSPGKGKSKGADMLQLYAMLIEMFKSVGSVLALSYVPSSFVVFLIRERCIGSKSLQFMSGLNRTIYWLATYIWDVCNFLVPMAIIILIFLAFGEEAYVGADSVGGFITLMLIYGICNIPLMYLFTFVFRVPSLAFVVLLAANLMIAVVTSVTVFLLDMVQSEDPGVKPVNEVLKQVFLIFPQYTFARGFYNMSLRYAIKSLQLGKFFNTDLFGWDMLGSKITALLVEAFIFFGVVLFVEYKSATCRCGCRRKQGAGDAIVDSCDEVRMDPDVREERLRVYRDDTNRANDIIRVMSVTKRFPKKKTPAVDDLTFGVRTGECFGLLGVNGAGKTTTFNMLTTTIKPDRGEIWVNGCNLATDAHQAQAQMGYCPQFDALHEHLTGYETLQFFARIRGFPEDEIKPIIDALLDRMSLRPHANKRAGTYSGGNLRKLSTAVAILGNPRVLLLDEPTSGMDPGAKRYLWEVLKSLMRENCSIVLTSHSMEECEALCNRVGIMVAGQFHCFGTVPHLKERFGEGYIVEVDIRVPVERVTAGLRGALGAESVHLTETVGQRLTYQTSMQVSLALLFKQLVSMRDAGELHTFAVRQASLDSVFINFVRKQMEEEEGWEETWEQQQQQDANKAEMIL